MFDDNNQVQPAQTNNPASPIGTPVNPPTGGLSSFTMDAPKPDPAVSIPQPEPSSAPLASEPPASLSNDNTDKPASTTPAAGDDSLMDIKQQALTQLQPMLGHLDQSPEEKFRTTMMMIQANDDKSLIKDAYEAAQQITDEKAKAQALLDVVNEINYFTHNGD